MSFEQTFPTHVPLSFSSPSIATPTPTPTPTPTSTSTPMPFLEAASLASRCRDGSLSATLFQHRDFFDLMLKIVIETQQRINQSESNSTSKVPSEGQHAPNQTLDIPKTIPSEAQSQSLTRPITPQPLPQAQTGLLVRPAPTTTVTVSELFIPCATTVMAPLTVTFLAIEQLKRGLKVPITITQSLRMIPTSLDTQLSWLSILRDHIDCIARIFDLETSLRHHRKDVDLLLNRYDPSKPDPELDKLRSTMKSLTDEQLTLTTQIRERWYSDAQQKIYPVQSFENPT